MKIINLKGLRERFFHKNKSELEKLNDFRIHAGFFSEEKEKSFDERQSLSLQENYYTDSGLYFATASLPNDIHIAGRGENIERWNAILEHELLHLAIHHASGIMGKNQNNVLHYSWSKNGNYFSINNAK